MFSIALKRLWKCLQKPSDPLLQTDFQSLCGDFTSGTITDNVPNKGAGGEGSSLVLFTWTYVKSTIAE